MSRRGRALIRSRFGVLLGAVGAVWFLSVTARADVNGPTQLQAAAPETDIPAGEGSEILRRRCLGCHATDLIGQQRLPRSGWERELEKMISWGAAVEDSEKKELVDYLTAHFGSVRPSQRAPGDLAGSAAALLETNCQTCHDLRLIEAQRLDVSGWAREVDKMNNWGARISASEKDALVQYLAARFRN
jgi:cytochrome c5